MVNPLDMQEIMIAALAPVVPVVAGAMLAIFVSLTLMGYFWQRFTENDD